MRINTACAFIMALIVHLAIVLVLIINIQLEKPTRPESKSGKIMQARVVQLQKKASDKDELNAVETKTTAMDKSLHKLKANKEKARLEKIKAEQERKAKLERQKKLKELALKRKQEELEKKRLAEELKRKAELEKKKQEELKKAAEEQRKALEEQQRLAEEKRLAELKKAQEEAERKRKAEEAKRKAAEELKRKHEILERAREQRRKEQEAKRARELLNQRQTIDDGNNGKMWDFGTSDGSKTTGSTAEIYGSRIEGLVLQNWRIDPSMQGKKVIVTFNVGSDGSILNPSCKGDKRVCKSALESIELIGMMPRPPRNCEDCKTVVLTMTPKL